MIAVIDDIGNDGSGDDNRSYLDHHSEINVLVGWALKTFLLLLLLLLPSQLYLGFTFFFFCLPSYITGSPSSSAFPAISRVHLLLLLPSQLYHGFTFFFCLPSCISGSPSSSSALPVLSWVHLLLLCLPSQLYLGFTFAFPAISRVHLLLLLPS